MTHESAHETTSESSLVYPTAVVEDGATVGPSTKIWHNVHVYAGVTLADEVLSLPVHPGLSRGDVQRVVDAMRELLDA